MWSLIIILIAIFLIWLILKVYFEKFDTVIAYTGGLGSGKTFKGVTQSIKLLKKNRFSVKFNNFKNRFLNIFRVEKKPINNEIPMLYSSIPIFIKVRKRKFKLYNLVKLKYKYWVVYNQNNEIKIERYIKRAEYEEMKSKNLITDINVDLWIESSLELTVGHLLLQDRIVSKCVVFLDEIGGFVSQYEYSNLINSSRALITLRLLYSY